jgi:hypothetical protein
MNSLKEVTLLQWVGVIILFNTTLLGGASQLGDLSLSAGMVKAILALATLGNGFLGGLVMMFGGSGTQISNVVAMGASIKANANATPALAQASVDPAQPNVGPATPDLRPTLQSIAKGA